MIEKCPICHGRCAVPADFYTGVTSTNTAMVPCRACGATGVITIPVNTHQNFSKDVNRNDMLDLNRRREC